ncbi:CBS domain-containing protein [Candidatus Saccharibacteria bacterium]|nr:CBS domain-containing protein [Candidatus Saccharibacteria bacterium]
MFEDLMKKFVKFIDPKLERYRPKKAPKIIPKYTPKTLEEFIGVLQRTPKSILSSNDRSRIAAIMNFDEKSVADLMVDKSKIIFVHQKDLLGPLTLDKLYRSGFTNFPVVDDKEHVKGIIHTEALNALEIKKTDRAEKFLDKNVCYLHETDSLNFVVEEIERTNSYYFLVLDKNESLAGFFTIQMLLDYLLG